jgi:3-oxo-5alpha-steroid 4-dehydrogenase
VSDIAPAATPHLPPEAAPIEPARAGDVAQWIDEADVVVVGLGAAGVCAAIEASEAGADVLALERAGAPGGTSALSGGIIYLGGGTPVQEACGFPDDPETMATFLLAACGPGADEAKVRRYCDDSVAHYHWLVEHGVPFKAEFCEEPNREPVTDAALLYSGGEDTWPFRELARPAPRGHCPQFPDTAGGFLMQCLLRAMDGTSTRVLTDARVERLVVDDDGRVVGVSARRDGTDVFVRARGGVVLTGGGFIFNETMVRTYCPDALRPNPAWRVGTDNDDGRVIRIGQGAGANVVRMDEFECALPIRPPNRLAKALLVNREGERYINEDTYTGRIGHESLVTQGGEVYLIVDEHLFTRNYVGMNITWAAETVEELARDIGLPPDALVATVEEYNRHAEHGDDPAFHKNPEWVVPLRTPFGAVDLRVASDAIYAPFTLGGLETDAEGRVLTTSSETPTAVPGLFAAGRSTAGIAAHGYVSGISLGDSTYFGRRAGAAAASSAVS